MVHSEAIAQEHSLLQRGAMPSDYMTDRDCCSDTEVVVVKEGREHGQ